MFERKQITSRLIMVRPAHFGYNPETAESNKFQQSVIDEQAERIAEQARHEFDAMVDQLRQAGVAVQVVEDTSEPVKADAVFPNNWLTLHTDGTLVTYPMLAPSRQNERRADVIEDLMSHFQVKRHIELENWEAQQKYLEGTGSLVLDRENRIAYACWSHRTSKEALAEFLAKMDYEAVTFHAVDSAGSPIYHTNVLMMVGQQYAMIGLEAIPDPQERAFVEQKLRETGKDIVTLSQEQLQQFAGNALQVCTREGKPLLVMSQSARHALTAAQVSTLEQYNPILSVSIPTIEKYGGGSARCMIAENFLPEKN